ncbi:hypothetical protein CTU88_18025 [Streptomyces sp. JV178]|uniref:hypothetical protein n=1 Tax=Streptomyces sp. JV178 TaxID=858632 RepID=UPI000C1B54C1|nr:hypothetical protein [Streptomyces sp. JV178]PIM70479.1 hypothetical protein CTU88_18025 [Streptomyces sp. JV178]
MIRIVTADRLLRLTEESEQTRARARDVQGEAGAVWAGHVRELWELTSRAESAETDAAILREEILRLEAALTAATADLTLLGEECEAARREGRSLVLLLHYGEPHSIHADHDAACAYVATLGIPVHAWVPSDERPAAQVLWRTVPFTRDEAVNGFRSVTVPAPEGREGAA